MTGTIDTGNAIIDVTNNAVQVTDKGYTPSSYAGATLTMNDSVQIVAVPTGARKINIYNRGATTEDVFIAPGVDAADAEDNIGFSTDHATTGTLIPAVADAGANAYQTFGIADATTHFAVCNAVAGDINTVVIGFGV